MISVVILGAGNVGTHLVKAVQTAENLNLIQWYFRDSKAIQFPIKDVELCHDLNRLKLADVYIIAVSDKAVSDLSKQLPFENRLVVHTSGSVAMKQLDMKHRRGVFYPLQTFSLTSDVAFSEVPFCIETMKKEDSKLKEAKLTKKMPPDWDRKNVFARHDKVGIVLIPNEYAALIKKKKKSN